MLRKTNRLRKLEQARWSILTPKLDKCFVCDNPKDDIHEIYGGANRVQSIKHGFCLPLCRQHHRKITNDADMDKFLKRMCQQKFEETHSRDEFMSIIGKNYLDIG